MLGATISPPDRAPAPSPHAGPLAKTARLASPGGTFPSDALAVLAHDVRGPLANLSILVEAMASEVDRGQFGRLSRHADKATRIIERLDGMMTAMLERARTLGDTLLAGRETVDLVDVIETVASLNRPLAERHGVRLHCLIAEPLHVKGEAHLLMQAIDNLLGNAITHSPRGACVVCEAAPARGGDVIVRIADQGPGLTADEIAGLFRAFGTLPARATQPRKSTGLGLAIVRRIAESHGGSVSAESRGAGAGATFSLRLPGNPASRS